MRTKAFILLVLLPLFVTAQSRRITHNDQVWFGDFSKIRLNDKWSVYFDLGLRRTDWLEQWSQTVLRPGITRKLNSNVSITAGLAWFDHYTSTVIRPEGRGWQQLLFTESFGRLKLSHRLRAEQRFNQAIKGGELVDDYNYNNRYRYQLSLQFALNKPVLQDRTAYIAVSDEVMLNSGKEIAYNYFDQNRLAAGIGYKWNDSFNVLVSYMNVFVQKNAIATFEKNNVLVINVYHEFGRNVRKAN
jgi:long-subunit fatty acid transport protein